MLHLIALEDNVLELLGRLLNLGGEEEAGRRDLQRERGRERQHEPWPTPMVVARTRASRPDRAVRAAPRGKGAAGRAAVARHLEFVIVRVRLAREEAVVEDDGRRDAQLGPARRERGRRVSQQLLCG